MTRSAAIWLDALVGADQCFDRRPFRLEFFRLGQTIVFEHLLDFGVDLWLFVFVQNDARDAAFVIDRHRRPILHRAGNVVNVDIVAEDRRRVAVVAFDGRAGEADEGGIGQRLPQIMRIAVAALARLRIEFGVETILAAVRLVGDDDDIAAVGQQREILFAGRRREFLQSGEDDPAG